MHKPFSSTLLSLASEALRILGNLVECLFEKHKFVRRSMVAWALTLITIAVLHPEKYTDAKFLSVVGLLTAVIGFYQWSRQNEK